MLATFKTRLNFLNYPRQFWLLFSGTFINRASVSMLWPFMTIYMYNTLDVPLTTVTLLLSGRAITSLLSTAIVSPMMDRVGRKGAMVVSLYLAALVFVGMALAQTLPLWAVLVAAHGAVMPIFTIGVDTMVADVVTPERRSKAYALIRMVSNAGIAIGPLIGGILAVISFQLIFYLTAAVYVVLGVLVALVVAETAPMNKAKNDEVPRGFGYGFVFRDRVFLAFCAAFLLTLMAYTQLFGLLPVYTAENYGLQENQYNQFLALNAAMVVFLQYGVTLFTARYEPRTVIFIGSLFYAVGLTSLAFGTALHHFLLSVAIITMGELIINPTAMSLVADLAPPNMRARYMGIFSIGYPVASGVGPVIGAFLNDTVAPQAIWYGAGVMALLGALGFFWLLRMRLPERSSYTPPGM